jgi:hypothetical protein
MTTETAQKYNLISKIVDRAIKLKYFPANERLNVSMDIQAAHKECNLRLADLLVARDIDFAHDVVGITNHINRETGTLGDAFLPRYHG